jgi:predicted phosphodiesterase
MNPQVSDTPIKRCFALIGDMHFGSIYAPMKPFKTQDGRTIYPSLEQEKLNHAFDWCAKIMRYWHVDTILFTGDLIQGKNVKDVSRCLVTADLDEQQQIAIDYLKPICKKRRIYGVSGTGYHQSVDTEIEQDIITELDGTFLSKMAWLTIPHSKRIINLSHASLKSTVYPMSAMEREATFMLRSYGEGKLPFKPDIIIRGHRHIFGHLHTSAYHFILVPSFQVWYPFQTGYYGALQSDIGIAILFIDMKDRIIIHHYTDNQDIRIGDKTYVLK